MIYIIQKKIWKNQPFFLYFINNLEVSDIHCNI